MNKGCNAADDNVHLSPPGYDLNEPFQVVLNAELNSISGIIYYPKDSSVFATVNNDGLLFKIPLHGNQAIMRWRFDRNSGYGNLELKDSSFFVVINTGDIETIEFKGSAIVTKRCVFPDSYKNKNEFESLFYDEQHKELVMLSKTGEEEKGKVVHAWGFSPESQKYTPDMFSIPLNGLEEKNKKGKEKKIKCLPSAAAINPVTNEIYILSPQNQLLLVADKDGNAKEAYYLDPEIYNNVSGISFTPKGDIIISNSVSESTAPKLLIVKRTLNNQPT